MLKFLSILNFVRIAYREIFNMKVSSNKQKESVMESIIDRQKWALEVKRQVFIIMEPDYYTTSLPSTDLLTNDFSTHVHALSIKASKLGILPAETIPLAAMLLDDVIVTDQVLDHLALYADDESFKALGSKVHSVEIHYTLNLDGLFDEFVAREVKRMIEWSGLTIASDFDQEELRVTTASTIEWLGRDSLPRIRTYALRIE